MPFQQVLEHIRLGQTIQTLAVVQHFLDLFPGKGINLLAGADLFAEGLHDTLHLGKTSAAVKLITVESVQAVAVGFVQLVQLVQQADALGGVVAEHLANQGGTVDAVLVPDIAAGQVAVALLKAENVVVGLALLFQQADLLPDKLEKPVRTLMVRTP